MILKGSFEGSRRFVYHTTHLHTTRAQMPAGMSSCLQNITMYDNVGNGHGWLGCTEKRERRGGQVVRK